MHLLLLELREHRRFLPLLHHELHQGGLSGSRTTLVVRYFAQALHRLENGQTGLRAASQFGNCTLKDTDCERYLSEGRRRRSLSGRGSADSRRANSLLRI